MNLLHIKYAVEVAETGSLNRAAEKLLIGQPNLSRAIKELEASLGTKIFERTSKGMRLTPDGRVFVDYAKSILKQVDTVEELFKTGAPVKRGFSVSVPRAGYVADALARFCAALPPGERSEIVYEETGALQAIQNILQKDYELGLLRYAETCDRRFRELLDEKGLIHTTVTAFRRVLVTRADSPFAAVEEVTPDTLRDGVEVAYIDPPIPSLSPEEMPHEDTPACSDRRVLVADRASALALLVAAPAAYIRTSPLPPALLSRLDLAQRPCADGGALYKDVLVYRREHKLSEAEQAFLDQLVQAKRDAIG